MLIGYLKVSQHQQHEKKQALKVISLMLDCEAKELEQMENVHDSKWSLGNFLSKPIVPSQATSKLASTHSDMPTTESISSGNSLTELLIQFIDRE